MRKPSSVLALLLGAFTLTLSALTQGSASAQSSAGWSGISHHPASDAIDFAVTYAPERGKIASTSCGCFWMQGGGVEAVYTFYRGFGAAASLSGGEASNLTGGNAVNKIDFLFGPRYTIRVHGLDEGRLNTRLFGQALFGGVHAFDGTFPASGQTTSSANAFAFEMGGGFDMSVTKLIGVRLFEANYYHSSLPNNRSDTQNDLKLTAGLTLRLHRR